jgi:hypothetical protein
VGPTYQTDYERLVGAVRARLKTAAFDAAWAEGRAMSLDQAIDFALASLEG